MAIKLAIPDAFPMYVILNSNIVCVSLCSSDYFIVCVYVPVYVHTRAEDIGHVSYYSSGTIHLVF